MALATPTRRALLDLPVNTFGTQPTSSTTSMKATGNGGLKRRLHEMEESEQLQPPPRVRLSQAAPQGTRVDIVLSEQASRASACHSGAVLNHCVFQVPPLVSRESSNHAPHRPEPSRSQPADAAEDIGDADSQNSYKDSMSSLVDFDPDETMASQQTAATEVTQPLPSRVRLQAESLRLRLRLAHFKVQTNQIHLPLSRLRLSSTEQEAQLPSPESPTTQRPSLPGLLPPPVLRPTAYSARTISYPHIPSSPPSSPDVSPERGTDKEGFRTPALPRPASKLASQQLSSPPDSQWGGRRYEDESDLTSSAVRGKAAIGLLGLRGVR